MKMNWMMKEGLKRTCMQTTEASTNGHREGSGHTTNGHTKQQISAGRLRGWCLDMSEYDFDIRDRNVGVRAEMDRRLESPVFGLGAVQADHRISDYYHIWTYVL